MSTETKRLSRAFLPISVFVAVVVVHFVWLGLFPEREAAQDRWVTVIPATESWLTRYIETQSYWLGFSYALSLTFAAVALRRSWNECARAARNLAIGGITLSGFLAVAGCFLLGCCGSPMLAVYLNLFGAAFLPLAKPLVAAITTLTILAAWWWMNRYCKRSAAACLAQETSNETSGAPVVD